MTGSHTGNVRIRNNKSNQCFQTGIVGGVRKDSSLSGSRRAAALRRKCESGLATAGLPPRPGHFIPSPLTDASLASMSCMGPNLAAAARTAIGVHPDCFYRRKDETGRAVRMSLTIRIANDRRQRRIRRPRKPSRGLKPPDSRIRAPERRQPKSDRDRGLSPTGDIPLFCQRFLKSQ